MTLSGGVTTIKTVWETGVNLRRKRAQLRAVAELLGVHRTYDYQYHTGLRSVLVEGHEDWYPAPNDFAVLARWTSPSYAAHYQAERLFSELPRFNSQEGMVLIGGPTAEIVSRAVYGYIFDRHTGTTEYHGGIVSLPYTWQADARRVSAIVKTPSEIVEHREGPAWYLVDSSVNPPRDWYPDVSMSGILRRDYLLITSTPAYYSESAMEHGRRLISIAGCHGVGTRSAERLLTQVRPRTQLLRAAQGSQAFQALFRCDVKNDGSEPLPLLPTSVDMVDFKTVPWDRDVATRATRAFDAFYPQWFQTLPVELVAPQAARERPRTPLTPGPASRPSGR